MSTIFRLAPVAVAGMLLFPGVSNAEILVNTSFDPPTISGQSYDPTPVPDGPLGTFKFDADFCNATANQDLGYRLESRTAELGGGNELLNRTGGSGDTSVLAFPPIDGYADVDLKPAECVQVTYEIGLQTLDPFRFFVDIWFDAAAVIGLNPPSNTFSPPYTSDNTGRFVDDFIVGDRPPGRGDPLVPGPTFKGLKWKGQKLTFGIDPGNEFRVRIYQARCNPRPRAVGTSPTTGYDAPIYEAVVTASSTPDPCRDCDYTASIPWFTPLEGCRYFLLIENTSTAGGVDQGGWGWTRGFRIQVGPQNYAYRWDGSRWRLQDNRFWFQFTD
jgi:hypothetical protein